MSKAVLKKAKIPVFKTCQLIVHKGNIIGVNFIDPEIRLRYEFIRLVAEKHLYVVANESDGQISGRLRAEDYRWTRD